MDNSENKSDGFVEFLASTPSPPRPFLTHKPTSNKKSSSPITHCTKTLQKNPLELNKELTTRKRYNKDEHSSCTKAKTKFFKTGTSPGKVVGKSLFNRLPVTIISKTPGKQHFQIERGKEANKKDVMSAYPPSNHQNQTPSKVSVPSVVPVSSGLQKMYNNEKLQIREEENEEDEDDQLSGILSQVGSMINKRLLAKKIRIENTFKMIQAPAALFDMQKSQSQSRIEKYRKYESTIDQFRLQLGGILQRHEKNTGIFLKMMESIQKGTRVITNEITTIQGGVDTLVKNMNDTLQTFEESLKDSEKAVVEGFAEELKKWELNCVKTAERQTVAELESFAKYI